MAFALAGAKPVARVERTIVVIDDRTAGSRVRIRRTILGRHGWLARWGAQIPGKRVQTVRKGGGHRIGRRR
jgi:hypothetical protein